MATSLLDDITLKIKQWSYSAKEQQSFLEDTYTLIEDGVPANRAIEAVSNISKGRNSEVASIIMGKIAEGKAIAEGMVGWFPTHILELIRAGESGGTLGQTMRSAAESLGKKNESVGAILNAMTYPAVVIILGLVVLVYINGSVFNQFKMIKPVSQWPQIGKNMVILADFLTGWWWIALLIIGLMTYGLRKVLREYVGEFRQYIDVVPLLILYKQTTAARFMETMGLLISNGVVFKEALRLLHHKASPYLAHHLLLMEQKLGTGKSNIAEVLDTGMLNTADIVRLQVTAASKGFEDALVRLGKRASDAAVKTVSTASKIMGGILLALGASLAGFMVLAIYSVGSVLSSG